MAPTLEEIEDVDDVDNMDFDPSDFDPRSPFAKSNPVTGGGAKLTPTAPSPPQAQEQVRPQGQAQASSSQQQQFIRSESDMEKFKDWQIIYPVYFDASKTHSEGRRVSKEMAVENPLAQTIMDACRTIGVHTVLEAQNTHPKDWANPGRVRVLIKPGSASGVQPSGKVQNKRHLFRLISDYLKSHPTTEKSPYESPVFRQFMAANQGMEEPECKPLAVPQGWKINSVLPVNSRAVSGGEQNEKMMDQMKGMFPGMNMPDPPKQKKIKIRAR